MLRQLATTLSSLGPLYQFLMLFAFLVLVWLIIKPFPKLHRYRGQILVLAAVAWVSSLFALLTYSFPVARGMMASATDAGTIPRLYFTAIIPCIIVALIPILKGKEKPDPKLGNIRLVATVGALVVINLYMFQWIGYYISSALFIFVFMLLLKARNKVQLISVPVVWVLFSYFVFAKALMVPLPTGALFSFLQ